MNLIKYIKVSRQKILIFLILIFSCERNQNINEIVNSIQLDINVERFDEFFVDTTKFKLNDLKNKYPFFFPKQFRDSLWINRRNDSLQIFLQNEISKKISETKMINDPVQRLFKFIKFYFPKYKIPRVITVSNNVDYQNKIILNDSLLIISIDTYLGIDNDIYDGIPKYMVNDMDLNFLTSHISEKFANLKIPISNDRTFISQIIYYGKKLYLKDLLIGNQSDEIKIGYTQEQLEWAKKNELFIWRYFVEKEILFKTHTSLTNRFIDPAPFSKFYLEIDNLTPGKIGQWIGWQIVRSYVKNNPKNDLYDLINEKEYEIFKNSNYKPSK